MQAVESKRPPPYPAPITTPQQRAASQAIRNELRESSSPIYASSRTIPMDGALGVIVIVLLACMMLTMNLLALLRADFREDRSQLWALLPANAIIVLGIVGAILRRRAHQRLRRVSRGQCPWCGYSLHGTTSDKCPECGNPAVRMKLE